MISNSVGGDMSYIWKSVSVHLALFQQTQCDGLHRPHRLSTGRADERFRQEEAKVSRVPKFKGERVWDPVSVGPVYGAA